MISDVQITITREIARITRQGFGVPLLFHAGDDVNYAECRNLQGVVDAGFAATTDIYSMAAAIFRQSPSPPMIAVYGADIAAAPGANATAFLENSAGDGGVTITAEGALAGTDGNGITVEFIDEGSAGLSVAYVAEGKKLQINFGGAPNATCTALAAAIDGHANFAAAIVPETGDKTFVLADDMEVTAVTGGGYDDLPGGIKVKLQELIGTRNNWYFLLSDEKELDSVEALSEVAAGNKKIYFASPDASVANYIIKSKKLATNRTVLIYHDEAGKPDDPFVDAAWVGRCAPTDPGSITWKFKTLDGVPEANVNLTQLNDLHAANCNTYVSKLGVLQTSEGVTTSGEYIDITRGADWVEARMSERVHHLLFTMPKVPFDNRGIGLVKGEIEAVLQWATIRGIVAVDEFGRGRFEVHVPDRDDTDPIDRANRILKDVRFEFDLAGAIHRVVIHGVIKI